VAAARWDSVIDKWTRPRLNRQLYILIHDEKLQALDPDDQLYDILVRTLHRTVVEAKKLNANSLWFSKFVFEGVPVAARDRLLQLVAAAEVTGEQHSIYLYEICEFDTVTLMFSSARSCN
jgi:hypothetical protein